MSNERKEGVLITALSLLLLLTLSLITDWSAGFFNAYIQYYGFSFSTGDGPHGTVYEFEYFGFTAPKEYYRSDIFLNFSISYTTILIVILPFLFYGVLRASGVVKRIFSFEKSLSFLFHEQESKQEKID